MEESRHIRTCASTVYLPLPDPIRWALELWALGTNSLDKCLNNAIINLACRMAGANLFCHNKGENLCARNSSLQAFKASSLQAFKPSSLQAFKPSSLQAFKPSKLLILLLAALAFCLLAGCEGTTEESLGGELVIDIDTSGYIYTSDLDGTTWVANAYATGSDNSSKLVTVTLSFASSSWAITYNIADIGTATSSRSGSGSGSYSISNSSTPTISLNYTNSSNSTSTLMTLYYYTTYMSSNSNTLTLTPTDSDSNTTTYTLSSALRFTPQAD